VIALPKKPLKALVAFPVVVGVSLLVSGSAVAEKRLSTISAEEAQELSEPLKTYICTDEWSVPDWCRQYRAKKFRVSKRVASLIAKPTGDNLLPVEGAANKPPTQTLSAAFPWDGSEVVPESMGEVKPATTVEKKDLAKIQRSHRWAQFLKGGDLSSLSGNDIDLIISVASSDKVAEANEILGYLYKVGTASLKADPVKAYRHYGLARMGGLDRVKPNMDLIWKKLKKEQRQALVREFEYLAASATMPLVKLDQQMGPSSKLDSSLQTQTRRGLDG
jgi:hypothetical protein